MPIIDMAVDFDDIKDLDKGPPPLDSGTYQIQVASIEQKVTGPSSKTPGRPMLLWWIEVIDHPEHRGRRLPYNTVLPWINPSAPPGEERDTSGCGLLVALCKNVGMPWTGGQLVTEDYIGRTGSVLVGQGVIGAGPRKGEPTNSIKFIT